MNHRATDEHICQPHACACNVKYRSVPNFEMICNEIQMPNLTDFGLHSFVEHCQGRGNRPWPTWMGFHNLGNHKPNRVEMTILSCQSFPLFLCTMSLLDYTLLDFSRKETSITTSNQLVCKCCSTYKVKWWCGPLLVSIFITSSSIKLNP